MYRSAIHIIGMMAVVVLLVPLHVIAGHISGGEMFYQSNGRVGENYSYRVTLRLLMRCNSPRDFPGEVFISVFDRKDHDRIRDVRVSLTSRSQINRPPNDPCISNPPQLCFEVAEYTTDIELAGRPNGYLLSAQIILRVAGIANVGGASGSMGATYTAEIPGLADGEGALLNHSARFNSDDLVIMCAEHFFEYNFKALDGNNDSLRYRFCDAYQTQSFFSDVNNATPPESPPYPLVPYAPNFSGALPFGSRVSLNSSSGLAFGTAPESGTYLISICVDEIRGGKVIATQRKDIQVSIAGCNKAEAILEPEYNLCGESNTVFMVNLSRSSLIETYEWSLFNQSGIRVAGTSEARFSIELADTGLYKVVLHTNKGQQCRDSTFSVVRYYPGFKADFSFTGVCYGSPTRFKNQSSVLHGNITSYFWALDEPLSANNQANIADPVFRYETIGLRSVFLRIENTNGCKDSIFHPVTISDNPPVFLRFRDTLICRGDTLQLQAAGGGAFQWGEEAGFISVRNSPTPLVAPLLTTVYRVVQIEESCRGEDSVLVRVVQDITLKVNNDTTICSGDDIILKAEGNGLRFNWLPDDGIENPAAGITPAKPSGNITYGVKASIGNCIAVDSFRVIVIPYPLANAGQDKFICVGDSVMIGESFNSNRFRWMSNGAGLPPVVPNPYVRPDQTTIYVLQVFEDVGCPKPGIDSVVVFVQPPVSLSVTRDTVIVVNQALQLNASGAQRYQWIPSIGLSNTAIANPVALFSSPGDSVQYTLIGMNDGGCTDTVNVVVRVFANGPSIYVPTAFTPNGDGLNETLKPTLAGIQQMNYFRVFNRYGEIIFQTSSPRNAWDGRFKGQQQPSGSYVWMVQAVDFEGKVIQQKGSSTLIR